ncbi:MAG: glutamate racemase [Bacteroidetes bacterium]|nr:glutamate racemase [Bacteroidota bacterium]MDA1383154.1 glutamate racemase [Bacteroidota bacterium]
MSSLRPIGVFDSGIGGLTVARAIHDLLPEESILYFGDTAHLPYGEKSPELIQRYSTRIARHLVKSGCKAIVVACNSASSNALQAIISEVGPNIPVIDMVTPVVKYLSHNCAHACQVGLIGTRATIASGLYHRCLKDLSSHVELISKATPLLASAIEEGFFNDSIPQAVLDAYFSDNLFKDIDSIILGCTHYPLVKDAVKNLLPSGVEVIDSPSIVAEQLNSVLTAMGEKVTESNLKEKLHFQVSDLTENFKFSARHFFGDDLTLEEVVL